MNEFPARLHVLLASDAPLGLVIRRGPSKCVATIMWDRRRDEFQPGQWLKGRIYEKRSDLSPDGKHFIYFAMNGKWNEEARGAWTAISRAPYLKALSLFPKGDCWNGGGLWTGPKSYWLNDGYGHSVLRDSKDLRRDLKYTPSDHGNSEDLGVYFPRLLRDGWQQTDKDSAGKRKDRYIFDKAIGKGWLLRKIFHAETGAPVGKGCYWDEHQLIKSDVQIDCPDWEWAELDSKRLVWASKGKLFSGKLNATGLSDETELHDFNPMEFEAIAAPY